MARRDYSKAQVREIVKGWRLDLDRLEYAAMRARRPDGTKFHLAAAACAKRAAEARNVLAFLAWGRRSMAWGLCHRMGVTWFDAFDVVGDVVPQHEKAAAER